MARIVNSWCQTKLAVTVVSEGVDVVLLIENQSVTASTGHLQNLLLDAEVEEKGCGLLDNLDGLGWLAALSVLVVSPQEDAA